MKNLLILAIMLIKFGFANAQSEIDLSNKIFQQVDNIPNSTTELFFPSKNQVVYIITNVIKGKTYIDKCPGKATLNGNIVSINCNCEDKEIYPDPISDSFIYDSKSKTLTSKSYKSTDGFYFVWNLK
jgi:hypothetical protein